MYTRQMARNYFYDSASTFIRKNMREKLENWAKKKDNSNKNL